ncbi:MAG: aryl-sulfate sulfotransferase [Chloroflexi bacterium]|nr:aryl-sulfate sulfotransferase [Chloroflexota bacterium]
MTCVEQTTLKRAGVGLRACDPTKACAGMTLFTTMGSNSGVHLIDLNGQIVHTWDLAYPAIYGYLTERRTLIYNGRLPSDGGTFLDSTPWKAGVLMEVDWDGEVLWEIHHPNHHHDGIRLANGNVLLLCLQEVPVRLAQRVPGGTPGSEFNGRMYADYLVEMTIDGRSVWEWRSWEHLAPEKYPIVNMHDHRSEWTHGNAVAELPGGNLMLSFRHTSTVMIIDRQTGDTLWEMGPPLLHNQHAPSLLANGNLLIFDNGTHRGPLPYSRVLEIDPATRDVRWFYEDTPQIAFFSPIISNAQRLRNGNTLINEGASGRLFEVTTDGEVVWEYVNPYFSGPAARGQQNAVFRAYRYPEVP